MKKLIVLALLAILIPNVFALTEQVEFGSPSDILEVSEYLEDVRETITGVDLPTGLKGFSITNAFGTVQANQYLRFFENSGNVVFDQDERDRVNHYLLFMDNDPLFKYELEFEMGLKSDITPVLTDIIGKEVFILGEKFTITNAFYSSTDSITIEFNNPTRNILFEDVLITSNENYQQAKVKVDGQLIEDSKVSITGSFNPIYTEVTINSIYYVLLSDAVLGDMYIASQQGVKSQLGEPEGLLTDKWDLVYEGLMDTGVTYVRFDVAGNREYDLEFTNQEGIFYDLPLASIRDVAVPFVYGTRDDNLWFTECMYPNYQPAYQIQSRDFFIVSNCMISDVNTFSLSTDNTCFTHTLRYDNIDTNNKKLTFTDLGIGAKEISYDNNNEGYLVISGIAYKVKVANPGVNNNLAIDLNGDTVIATELNNGGYGKVVVGIQGEGIIDLGYQACLDSSYNVLSRTYPIDTPNSTVPMGNQQTSTNINLITLQKEFDEAIENEVIKVTLKEVDLGGGQRFISIDRNSISTTSGFYFSGLKNLQENPDVWQALSGYGIFLELYDPVLGTEDLTFEYPLSQRGARVFVTFDNLTPEFEVKIIYPLDRSNLPVGKNELNVITNMPALCYFGYGRNPQNIMTDTGNLFHNQVIDVREGVNTIAVRCIQTPGVEAFDNALFFGEDKNKDTTPPEIIIIKPIADSTIIGEETLLEAKTNEEATCMFSLTRHLKFLGNPGGGAGGGTAVGLMFFTGGLEHEHLLENLTPTINNQTQEEWYEVGVHCRDRSDNPASARVIFFVQAEQISSLSLEVSIPLEIQQESTPMQVVPEPKNGRRAPRNSAVLSVDSFF